MQVFVVGMNHETSPVEIRERLALNGDRLKEASSALLDYVPQGIILSTCNRTEIYAYDKRERHPDEQLRCFLSSLSGVGAAELAPYLYSFHGEKAFVHLFRVACGLESMIVGEYEVLGQVRKALELAEAGGQTRLPLLNLFRTAVRVGRRCRQETGISRNAASVSAAAVELARKLFGDLARCKVLVIGAGEAGQLTARTLVDCGVSQVEVTSRTYERAVSLASEMGGKAIPFHAVEESLKGSDIVISCSGSPHFILEASAVSDAMASRSQRPLLLIDIAVPRDIVPEVKEIANVHLYDIDDLKGILGSNIRERQKEITKVEAIIDDEMARFVAWWASLKAVPTISALVDKTESIRNAQFDKMLKRVRDLSQEDRAAVEAMSKAIVKNILNHAVQHLRDGGSNGMHIQAVQDLFDLDVKV